MSDLDDELPTAALDFGTYVLSLSATCMIQLGELAGPDGVVAEDREGARNTFEVLLLLEAKTRGNLTGNEERVLSHAIHDLKARLDRR